MIKTSPSSITLVGRPHDAVRIAAGTGAGDQIGSLVDPTVDKIHMHAANDVAFAITNSGVQADPVISVVRELASGAGFSRSLPADLIWRVRRMIASQSPKVDGEIPATMRWKSEIVMPIRNSWPISKPILPNFQRIPQLVTTKSMPSF